MLHWFLKLASVALLTVWVVSPVALAQSGQRLRQWATQRQVAQQTGPNAGDGQPAGRLGEQPSKPNARGMAGLPPRWIERLQDLPPGEQQRFLQNNEQFHQLPPERQEQIRRNLERWNRLTPEQKEQARTAERAFERMTPQQRQYVRNVLLPKWQAMPQPRRQAINQRLRILRNMSPSTQQAALNDPKFVQGLSQDEQSMLRELNSLRNPAPGDRPPSH